MTDSTQRRLAVVTGGSRGLGLALLEAFESDGFKSLDLSRSGASDTARGRLHVRADFADPSATADAVARELDALAAESWDEVVFVSNAGTLDPIGPLAASSPADWRRGIDVNLTSAITAMALFVRAFQSSAARKTLVSVSSGAGSRGVAGWSLYCATKAGLDNWIRAVAIEQERESHPIRAVSIQPGIVDTQMQAEIRASDRALFANADHFVELKESGALYAPADVARAMLALVAGEFEPGALLRIEL
jgi:benzil reductase ((S)-benzoin forming)